MRTKSSGGPVKENLVREHYRRREYEKYGPGRPSSEDIWESREEKLPYGTAFTETVEVPQVTDDEWRKSENDRRKTIREGLGFTKSPPA